MNLTRTEVMTEPATRAQRSLTDHVGGLYVAHREEIFRFLAAQGIPAAMAQDITQEVFLKLLVTLRTGSRVDSPGAWLYRVAANRAIDYWRRERRLITVELDSDHPVAGSLESPDPSADDRVTQDQRMRRLGSEIRRLPKEQRMCILLRSQGMRYREISRVLGVGVSTAADWLEDAVARLRRAVDE